MRELFNKLVVRIQNPKVIVAVVSGLLLILSSTHIITIEHANHVTDILNTILTVFVGLGVFGNPESHVTVNKPEVVQEVEQAILAPDVQAPVQSVPAANVVQADTPVQTPVQQ